MRLAGTSPRRRYASAVSEARLNGKAGVSAKLALALEEIGWGAADHWMRMQVSDALAQARREHVA